jgi:predicted amidohydrolase YtcJ
MYDAGMNDSSQNLLLDYIKYFGRKVRIGAAYVCDANSLIPIYTPPSEYSDVYLGHIKLVSDGSNQGLTGYQSVEYCCPAPNPYGIFNFTDPGQSRPSTPPNAYTNLVNSVMNASGWPIMIHANGDYAVDFAISAMIGAGAGTNDHRNRIEHCSILSPELIQQMATYKISPSFLIGHVGYWGYAFLEAIFKSKAQYLDLCNSALAAGLRISLHSDNEVSPLGPLRMMEQSITRIMEAMPSSNTEITTVSLNPDECITPEQALRAITYDAAWQCYADDWIGSLDIGKYADFVILDQDPLSLTDYYMNLRNIPVAETWLGGECVYTPTPAEVLQAS